MEVGRIIGGKYRLQNEIGEGAMGSVWAGIHEVLGRPVAIKFLLPSAEGVDTAAARFVAEAQAAARVKHRFTVDVFDFGITEDGGYYMVQELLEGEPLSECMHAGPAWTLTEVLQFTAQCLSGLEAVHQSGIVHRDLKPDNIFVIRDAEGTHPKLLDFGISRWAEATSAMIARLPLRSSEPLRPGRPRRLTGTGTTLGTPAYMSPEQLCNANTMNGRADLYSMGVVLYEWLSGTVPFGDSANTVELYRRISARNGQPIRALRPDLGPEVWALIDRALEPDPEQRFASAGEMRAQVLRILPSVPHVWSVVQTSAEPENLVAKALSERDRETELTLPVGDSIRIGSMLLPRFWAWGLGGSLVGGLVLTIALMQSGPRDHARGGGTVTVERTQSTGAGARMAGRVPAAQVSAQLTTERAQASAPDAPALPVGREAPETLEMQPDNHEPTVRKEVDAGARTSRAAARVSRRRTRREATRRAERAETGNPKALSVAGKSEPKTSAPTTVPTSAKVIRTPDF